jgi:hypothetical protein
MIVYLKSDESNSYFPDNKPWNFKVRMDSPLIFQGIWKVALTDFYAAGSKTPTKILNIFSNISDTSILGGYHRQILRRVTTEKDSQWNICVNTPFYLRMCLNEIYEFDIRIKDVNDQEASFLQEPTLLTLHFVREQ